MTANSVQQAWAERGPGWSRTEALQRAATTPWLVGGVIPAASIVWVAGKPASGKTFAMMELAACVSTGRTWHGHECTQATVVYVAAEGGDDINTRAAGAELAAGVSGPLLIEQTRPQVGEPEGLAELMALVQYATRGEVSFKQVIDFEPGKYEPYLTPAELKQKDDWGDLEMWERDLKNGKIQEKVNGKRTERPLTQGERQNLENRISAARAQCENPPEDSETWAYDLAEARYTHAEKAIYKYHEYRRDSLPPKEAKNKRVLLILDTFSQTAPDDSKTAVSRYIKNLRELIEQSEGAVSVIVVDHLTKSGDSYMGALAKQGDSDAMIEVEARGQLVTLTCPDKMKAAKPFEPVRLELVPFTLDGYCDAQNRPLSTLVVQDGERVHRLRKAAGGTDASAAAVVLALLSEAGPHTRDTLRAQFSAHPTQAGKKADTVGRAFRRALESLEDENAIELMGEEVVFALV
jgi:hypothetical protein